MLTQTKTYTQNAPGHDNPPALGFWSSVLELVCKISILQRSNLILASVPTKSSTHERPMISLRMGLTSGIATSSGSSKPTEIKQQVMHRKGFSLLGGFRESSMAPMRQAEEF